MQLSTTWQLYWPFFIYVPKVIIKQKQEVGKFWNYFTNVEVWNRQVRTRLSKPWYKKNQPKKFRIQICKDLSDLSSPILTFCCITYKSTTLKPQVFVEPIEKNNNWILVWKSYF